MLYIPEMIRRHDYVVSVWQAIINLFHVRKRVQLKNVLPYYKMLH